MRLARRMDRRRFPLSWEARELLRACPGRWRLVELADGDAAQGQLLGGGTGGAVVPALPIAVQPDLPEPAAPDQHDLFNLET